jgi:hypothetical protein
VATAGKHGIGGEVGLGFDVGVRSGPAPAALLDDVGELVGDQAPAGNRFGGVGAGCEGDMAVDGEGCGAQRAAEAIRERGCMDNDGAEPRTETILDFLAKEPWQRRSRLAAQSLSRSRYPP